MRHGVHERELDENEHLGIAHVQRGERGVERRPVDKRPIHARRAEERETEIERKEVRGLEVCDE